MIISRKHAKSLIRRGVAWEVGRCTGGNRWPEYPHYVIIERSDLQRTDHYPASTTDDERMDFLAATA